MFDVKKLDEGLTKLTGYDLEVVEQEERLAGNKQLELSLSKSFQARLGARALGLNVHDVKQWPLKQYNLLCVNVFGFLNEPELAATT